MYHQKHKRTKTIWYSSYENKEIKAQHEQVHFFSFSIVNYNKLMNLQHRNILTTDNTTQNRFSFSASCRSVRDLFSSFKPEGKHPSTCENPPFLIRDPQLPVPNAFQSDWLSCWPPAQRASV